VRIFPPASFAVRVTVVPLPELTELELVAMVEALRDKAPGVTVIVGRLVPRETPLTVAEMVVADPVTMPVKIVV
jgi:hypothetical protein